MISLRAHNVIDYFLGGWLIVSPWVFGFSDLMRATDLFVWGGLALIIYSLLTNYEFSAVKILPLGLHMTLDAMLGLMIILAPALFGYRDLLTHGQYAAHIVLGVFTVGFVALTRPQESHVNERLPAFDHKRDRAAQPV